MEKQSVDISKKSKPSLKLGGGQVKIPIIRKCLYLGTMLSYDDFQKQTIDMRIQAGWNNFRRLQPWLCRKRKVSLALRLKIMNTNHHIRHPLHTLQHLVDQAHVSMRLALTCVPSQDNIHSTSWTAWIFQDLDNFKIGPPCWISDFRRRGSESCLWFLFFPHLLISGTSKTSHACAPQVQARWN